MSCLHDGLSRVHALCVSRAFPPRTASNIHVNMDVEINDNLHVELADVWYDAMKQLDEAKANNIEAKTKSD